MIVDAKKDEVEVSIVTVRENEAGNAEVTNEDATTAGTKIEKRSGAGAGARAGEVETTTEKEEAEVAIKTEKGDEVLIVKSRGEEVAGKKREAERMKGHAADETLQNY